MKDYHAQRKTLIEEMSRIERMQRGRLTEEYRQREVEGKVRESGPYFKHQVWSEGKNVSRRVKADEARRLRDDIAGLDRFKELSAQYIEATVAMTNEAGDAEGKKPQDSLAGAFRRDRAFCGECDGAAPRRGSGQHGVAGAGP